MYIYKPQTSFVRISFDFIKQVPNMKRRFYLPVIISLLLGACNDVPETPVPASSSVRQPIINGQLATNDSHTVALMKVPGDESVMDYYSLCPESGQRECRNNFSGQSVVCLMDYSGSWCPNTCSRPGTTGYRCFDDDENGYSYLYPFRCVDYDGTYVWTSDYYDGPRVICENGCNADGDGCDAYGINQHRPCPDGLGCDDSDKLCLFVNSDSNFRCVNQCSSPGSVTHSCECSEETYGSVCYEYTYRCTAVDYNGTTRYAKIFEDSRKCTWGCSGNTCKEYSVSYTPVAGGVAADSFCSGTLIHPQWVLTAAHCIVNSDDHSKYDKGVLKTRIGIGVDTRSILSFEPDEFSHFYYHEKYKSTSTYAGDIALIRLRNPVPSNIAQPALPLPPWLAFNSDDLPIDTRTSGYGYDETGMSDRLLTIDLQTTGYCGTYNRWDDDECYVGTVSYSGCHPSPALCATRGPANVTNKRITIPSGMIYTPIANGGQCSGDSGGPTYYEVGGVEYVAGVTSYGDSQCRGYNVSTAVADYYDWIISIAPEVALQYYEICGNGVDDDGNGLTDSEDPACDFCGNARLDVGEVCDGNLYVTGSQLCSSWSSDFASGYLQCNHCELDFSRCKPVGMATCGNGALDNGETCDGNLFAGGKTACSAWDEKYGSGNVICNACSIDYRNCVEKPACGNGILDNGEPCDGDLFSGGNTACSAWNANYMSGDVSCRNCAIDYTNCIERPACGNGVLDNGETCDGNLFAGTKTACSAWDENYQSGTVSCNACEIDYTNCVAKPSCGNGVLDSSESCDGNLFAGGKTACSAWDPKYMSGTVSCNNCALDYADCVEKPFCGNGLLDDGEICDGNLFKDGVVSCSAWDEKYVSGTVSCRSDCTLSYYQCKKPPTACGNGVLEDGEVCDGDLFPAGKYACSDWSTSYNSGTVTCDNCTIDYSGCVLKPHCGNHILDNEESCDDNLFAGGKTTCSAWDDKYSSGTVSCDNCAVDYTNCVEKPACGNGILDNGEVCDSKLFAGGSNACSAWDEKYISGNVSCKNCAINYNNCVTRPACGNGILDKNEACDDTLFVGGKTSCKDIDRKYISGDVSCNADCTLNVSNCEEDHSYMCHNGLLDNGEVCDGILFAGGKTACSEWDARYISGNVSCHDCSIDYSGCVLNPACGNGLLDNGEPCEGDIFAGGKTTCSAWDAKYVSGNVTCVNCAIDYSQCIEKNTCGNGVLDNGEACDDTRFAGGKKRCSEWDAKYDSGNVTCNNCTIDYSQCIEKPSCGNGILDNGEVCDGTLFAESKATCSEWDDKYISGRVFCNKKCSLDFGLCVEKPACGNGILDAGEACDGDLFSGGKTACNAWNNKYLSGEITCNQCAVDYSQCVEYPSCGNGILDNNEACDGKLFSGGKKLCRDWDDKYISGEVTCFYCTVDYSECEVSSKASEDGCSASPLRRSQSPAAILVMLCIAAILRRRSIRME